jgi:hypothetical protein
LIIEKILSYIIKESVPNVNATTNATNNVTANATNNVTANETTNAMILNPQHVELINSLIS